MPRTVITAQTPKGPYPGPIAPGDLSLTFTAADVSNGNEFPLSGHEVLIAYNSGASPYTITLTSTPDTRGRSADISAYSVAAGAFAFFSYLAGTEGWMESDSAAWISASNAAILFAVLRVQR
jgi:hypothetical protein